MKGFALVAQFTFQPSRTYAQYDLAVLVTIPDIDETMTVVLASADKSMYPSVASRELATITSDYPENIFYTDGSMIDDVAGFAVHNRNYETGHQLAKPSSVFSAEFSAISLALEHIQICPRGRYLILSDSLSSLIAMSSRRITCKTHPWVYESKQIYWDHQQLNYDVKLMWIPYHVGSSGNEVADGLAKKAVESGTVQR
jgi:ribonuclease HI